MLESERAESSRPTDPEANTTESLVLRRDFVTLVKLFRDVLYELSRLRMLLNRVQVEPHLANSLRLLEAGSAAVEPAAKSASSGLLAPIARLFSAAMPAESEPLSPTSPANVRPPPKRTVSNAVTSTEVSVQFGSGAVRRAIASDSTAPAEVGAKSVPTAGSIGRGSGQQVRRDLNSIFVGASNPAAVAKPAVSESWFSRAAPSTNPLGRLLASYRPAPNSTTNAILDSMPHVPQVHREAQPTLLENQLRRRGLSDSSIRSTFVAHANPHQRIISPVTLALSSETSPSPTIPILVQGTDDSVTLGEVSIDNGATLRPSARHQLSTSLLATSTLNKRPSAAQLRSKKSTPQLRSVSATRSDTAVPPPLPSSGSQHVSDASPSVPQTAPVTVPLSSALGSSLQSPAQVASTSLLGTISQWASGSRSSTPLAPSPLAAAAESGARSVSDKKRSTPLPVGSCDAGKASSESQGPDSLSTSASGRSSSSIVDLSERSRRDC